MVGYEVRGPLAFITLDRPEKLNAINGEMIAALHDALDRAEAEERVRVIVVRGSGRAFSAGFDLEEAYDDSLEDPVKAEIERDFELIMRFWDCPKPTMASAHGICLGGAFEILLACDLAVATRDCRLGEPEVKFGSGVVAMLLPWICGPKRAAEIILGGEDRLDAQTAADWGILNRAVPVAELEPTTQDLALKLARNDTRAVRLAKRALKRGYDKAGLREALQEGVRHCIEVEREPSAESERFHDIVRRDGTAEAIRWLDGKLNTEELKGQRYE